MINSFLFNIVPLANFMSELGSDFNLVLKIIVFITIISYVKNHLGGGIISVMVVLGAGWLIIFDYWGFFATVYVLYMALALGVTGVLIDFFFVGGGGQEKGMESPVSSAGDLQKRQNFAKGFMKRR